MAASTCDAVIVVPPFGSVDRPCLAAHLLQACAKQAGMRVAVFYANFRLAAQIGRASYDTISFSPTSHLAGEAVFRELAFPGISRPADHMNELPLVRSGAAHSSLQSALNELGEHPDILTLWRDSVTQRILAINPAVVGCTTTFQQTAASIAILSDVKRQRPSIITIMGGANCDGEMSKGVLSLSSFVDYVFSGESEGTFPEFLRHILADNRPQFRIINGTPLQTLDGLPLPDYAEFYAQHKECFRHDGDRFGDTWLPYESSRGCWWGEKRHCTFCGINGSTMAFRAKSASVVMRELQTLLSRHPTGLVSMVDNIMPRSYFKTLLPELAKSSLGASIFYEQKANLSYNDMLALKRGSVNLIQPGIESLSTAVLRLMKKGATARINLNCLRFARIADVALNWNLLYGFPGDCSSDYEEMLAVLSCIHHLPPPASCSPIRIDRFSPYYQNPEEYGVANVRPMSAYLRVFPADADVDKLAYHFDADFESSSLQDRNLISCMSDEVERWRSSWNNANSSPPMLHIDSLGDDLYLLIDTRELNKQQFRLLNKHDALLLLSGCEASQKHSVLWAVEQRLLAVIDGFLCPLATASNSVICELLNEDGPPDCEQSATQAPTQSILLR